MFQQLAFAIVSFCLFFAVDARHNIFTGNFQREKDSSPPPVHEFWLHEGDIKLSKNQNEMLEVPRTREEKPSSGRAYTEARQEKPLWYGGIIPYSIDCSLKNMPGLVAVVKRAMRAWEAKTCVLFVERDQEEDYVEIFRGTHCFSTVGRVKGRKVLSVGHGCEYHNVMLHELGHVIGYWHEQSRPDRDDHIRVLWKNIMPGWENTFVKLNWKAVDTARLPYDYSSIMHYPFNAFSKNTRRRTIVPLRPVKARPYRRISQIDILKTNILYSCSAEHGEDNRADSSTQQTSIAALRRKRRTVDVEQIDAGYSPAYRHSNPNCVDKVGTQTCKYWALKGFCTKRKDFMLTDCAKSCNACSKAVDVSYSSTHPPQVTLVAHVSPIIQHGKSSIIMTERDRKKQRKEAKRKARKELKLIQEKRRLLCKDKSKSCSYWAKKGFCAIRPDFMLKHCRKSCNKCYPDNSECVDRDPRCNAWARWRYCKRPQYKLVMESFCAKTCGLCAAAANVCLDKERFKCPKWKDNGFCESQDKDIKKAMKMLCMKTCHLCDEEQKTIPVPVKTEPTCVDKFNTCQGWHKLGFCETRTTFMNKYCRKSCKMCASDTNKKPGAKCLDNAVGCEQRKAQGYCEKRRKTMKFYCRKTCGFCLKVEKKKNNPDVQSGVPCLDKNSMCPRWASYGYCRTKALYMIKYCKRTCGICEENSSNPSAQNVRAGTSSSRTRATCLNKRSSCSYWARIGMCKIRPDIMLKECRLACHACKPEKELKPLECKNIADDDNCKHWTQLGKCSSRPSFMIIQCPKSCNACPSRPVKTIPAKPIGILCQLSCKMWLERGFCAKWRDRCLRTCLANGCDVEIVRPVGTCAKPMGASWGTKLLDSAFSASSVLKNGEWDFGAHNARLYKEDDRVKKNIGGWCAKQSKDQWLQVDLGSMQIITAVATQGRDKFFEHIKSFELGFSVDGKKFYKYREKRKTKILRGNCDHFTPVINQLHRPHAARYIRFYPKTYSNVCMRVEIYGCDKLEGQSQTDYPIVIYPRHYMH